MTAIGGYDGDDVTVKGINTVTGEAENINEITIGGVKRLAVDTIFNGKTSITTPCYSSKKTFDVSNATVNLTTSFVDQYAYTGTGKFIGFVMTFTHKGSTIKLVIDGDVVFELSADDVEKAQGNTSADDNLGIVWNSNKKTITYYPRFPVCFATGVNIKAKKTTSNTDRTYYLVSIEKVT